MKNTVELALQYTGHFLLNCYCREIAGPNGLLFYPDVSANKARSASGCLLAVDFPFSSLRLLMFIEKTSTTCNYHYLGQPWIAEISPERMSRAAEEHQDLQSCTPLAWRDLPAMIVSELCRRFAPATQAELLAQIHNSREILARILDHHLSLGRAAGSAVAGFLQSEAGLIFGHTFHPAPKSRQGLNESELAQYSPEFHPAFPLHYFAVRPEYLRVLHTGPVDVRALFQWSAGLAGDDLPQGWGLIPCHPWQARYLLALPPVTEALKAQQLKYLGASGRTFNPTASVRTLFNADFPYFLKVSLSLRITNSVRKNAWYELESAVALSELLAPVANALAERFNGFSVLAEPVAVTVDLPQAEMRERMDLQSHFGVILRSNPFYAEPDRQAVLAGTVFADDVDGRSNVAVLIDRFRQRWYPNLDRSTAAVRWFEQYVKCLLPPVLRAFFEHGVAFEPHLQNVLLRIEDHAVSGIVLRDMEGTKLDKSRWPVEVLPSMSERAKASISHDRNTAWRRVVYCLFINNLCQAVFHCGRGLASDTVLWDVVHRELQTYIRNDGGDLCRELAGALLTGDDLPGKANLMTRFMQQADSQAHYIPVPNPLLQRDRIEQPATPAVEAALI